MFKNILKALAPVALLALMSVSAPVAAQPFPIPNLEIRIVRTAPPGIRRERMPPRPNRQDVFVKGYWNWDGAQWNWISARWERPQVRHQRWIAARYHRDGKVWRYEPPHWSNERLIQGEEYHHWKGEKHRR